MYASLQTDSHLDETLFNQITWRVIHYLNFAFQFEGCMIGCYILYRFAAGEVCWCFYKYGNGMKSGSSQHQSRRCPNHWDQISSQRLFSQTDKISLDIGGLKVTQRWYYVNIWHSFEIEMSRGKNWCWKLWCWDEETDSKRENENACPSSPLILQTLDPPSHFQIVKVGACDCLM